MSGSTKYIFSSGELHRKDNSLVLKNKLGNTYFPVINVKEIYCMSEVAFNTKLLDFLSRAGIVLHIFNYYKNYSGTFYPKEQLVSGNLTVKQALFYQNNKEYIAKNIVEGIAINIHEVLYHYYRHNKKELKPLLDFLNKKVPIFLNKDININQIMFIEGQIWNKFYDSFRIFLPEDFVLNKRVRRPPDNPINALISFGNMMLYTKTISKIYNTHLNQTISFLHSPREGRFSLSLDLSEVFKPIIVFKTIFDLVGRKKIQVNKHFDKKMNYAILNDTGKKIFIEAFEERLKKTFLHPKLKRKTSLASCIKYDGYKLTKTILHGIEFKPFSIKDNF